MIDKLALKDILCLFFWFFTIGFGAIGYLLWTIRQDVNIILKANSIIARALTQKTENQ